MDLSSNTVLVTGGASGIGLAFTRRFLAAGSRVIICGRREESLAQARRENPGVATRVCDLAEETARAALCDWLLREHPDLNVLVHNAGIQRRIELARDEPWERTHEEIAINLEAPIHLTRLLLPHLATKKRAAIIHIGSGLAFAPLARVPVYCATKAAIHSFTVSLRHQLEGTPIRVVEVAPPAVDTDLGGPGLHTFGVAVEELLDFVFPRLEAGDLEIAYGFAAQSSRASREEIDAIVRRMNAPEA
jgi:uncharacterized oxidoreductase